MAQQVKNLTAVQEMQETGSIPGSGRTLVREDPLSRKQQPTSVLLPGKSQRTEEPGGLYIVHEVAKESDTTEHTRMHAFLEMTGRTLGK